MLPRIQCLHMYVTYNYLKVGVYMFIYSKTKQNFIALYLFSLLSDTVVFLSSRFLKSGPIVFLSSNLEMKTFILPMSAG